MLSSLVPLILTLALVPTQGGDVNLASVPWNSQNCLGGTVTDVICCRDEHCSALKNKNDCDKEDTCRWGQNPQTNRQECRTNRDANNKVCCRSEVNEFCDDLTDGKCPKHFQVSKQCCSELGQRYTGVLQVENPQEQVCCNTPCTDARNNPQCPLPQKCKDNPSLRSLGGYQGAGPYNFGPVFSQSYLHGSPSYGNVYSYTGLENSYYQLPGKEHSSVGKVEEITVDDLMDALCEALSNDNDVFSYSAEVYSDPLLGKAKYGGPLGSFNLPDPNVFLKQIYGNPYGLSSGQFGYYGQGWPQVQGVYPGNGYGYQTNYYTPYNYGYNQGYGYNQYSPYGNYGYGQSYNSGYGNPGSSYGNYGSNYGNYGSNQGYGSSYGSNQAYGSSYGQGYGSTSYGNNQGYGQSSQSYS